MIARIVGFSAFALALVLLLMHNTGTIREQAEQNGAQAQVIAQKEQDIAQARQIAAEAEMERDRIEAQRKADVEALARRLSANEEALERANARLARFTAVEETSENYRHWADDHHPAELVSLLNDESTTIAPAGADSAHGNASGSSSGGVDTAVPHE